jgi:molecular chaperone DnaK (HSP70)
VAGIDLGTTNSVICVQEQASKAGVGRITCISDPDTNSPIVPSFVSFLEPHELPDLPLPRRPAPAGPSLLDPDFSRVVVGRRAKLRADTHPHHTLYSAKRVLGRPFDDPAVAQLQNEVEFDVVRASRGGGEHDGDDASDDDPDDGDSVRFRVPGVPRLVPPYQVGAYVVRHLSRIARRALGHDNVKGAVICVPAQFDARQRRDTVRAFELGGIRPVRILEEPTAAALAYNLHAKRGVDYVLVYDFGGGTLDVSLLRVTSGFVDVIGSDGDDLLGGTDFDAAVARRWMDGAVRVAEPGGGGAEVEETGGSVVNRTLRHLLRLQSLVGPGADLEGRLASECGQTLSETPLCTVSSFHSLAEQAKIELSSSSSSSSSTGATGAVDVSEATCLAPPRPPPPTDSGAESGPLAEYSSVKEFCSDLVPVRLALTGNELLEAVGPLLRRSLAPVRRLLDGVGLSPEEVPEVVLVGGTTRLQSVRDLVSAYFAGSTINTSIDPDLTVAYGAASVID